MNGFICKLLSLLLFIGLSTNVYSQDSYRGFSYKGVNIQLSDYTTVLIFLTDNGYLEKVGAASCKFGDDEKILKYFDQDNRLIEEAYIDANNDVVTKQYDANGKMLSKSKMTKASILQEVKEWGEKHKKQDEADNRQLEVTSALRKLSTAAETYAVTYNGYYPQKMSDLIEATPPFLNECTCDKEIYSYHIFCELREDGYQFIAYPTVSDLDYYIISTGGILEVKKHGELTVKIPFENSKSPCRE